VSQLTWAVEPKYEPVAIPAWDEPKDICPRVGGRLARLAPVDEAHRALLAEIRHRLQAARDDPNVTNVDGSNYSAPRVTRAIGVREDDGPALVQYIKDVLRKTGESEGWSALLEADRLDISFEDMVLNAVDPIRGLFSDEDRRIAAQSLGEQQGEIDRRREYAEGVELERDRRIVADVARKRQAAGKLWNAEMEAQMLAELAEKRRRDN
jgi:hypothetical protein